MRSLPHFSPGGRARFFCAATILLAGFFSVGVAAQQPAGAPTAPTEPPAQAAFANPIPSVRLAFLSKYAGQPVKVLRKDKQFRAVMKLAVPRTEYHYGWDMSLSDAIDTVLNGSTTPVSILDGRYALIPGRNGPYLHGRGIMWFDIAQGEAIGAFYFKPTNGEPTPTLTVFSRQLTEDSLGMSQLPPAFGEALNEWAMAQHIPVVSPTYFIPKNGKKYVLIHDRDYCGAASDTSGAGPAPSVCEQLNANAADDDVNAAYFMKETHNAANATAWVLGPDQIAWVTLRERRCGAGLPCRIAMTRERTRVLIGPPAPPRSRLPSRGPRGR